MRILTCFEFVELILLGRTECLNQSAPAAFSYLAQGGDEVGNRELSLGKAANGFMPLLSRRWTRRSISSLLSDG